MTTSFTDPLLKYYTHEVLILCLLLSSKSVFFSFNFFYDSFTFTHVLIGYFLIKFMKEVITTLNENKQIKFLHCVSQTQKLRAHWQTRGRTFWEGSVCFSSTSAEKWNSKLGLTNLVELVTGLLRGNEALHEPISFHRLMFFSYWWSKNWGVSIFLDRWSIFDCSD